MSKETKNKIFWDTAVKSVDKDGNPCEAEFRLYVHKWRVPEPCPQTIYVKIEPSQLQQKPKFLTADEAEAKPKLRSNPIVAIIHAFKPHAETLRYHPIGDQSEWEVGEPYIPYSLTHNQTEYLKITVKWVEPAENGYIAFTNS